MTTGPTSWHSGHGRRLIGASDGGRCSGLIYYGRHFGCCQTWSLDAHVAAGDEAYPSQPLVEVNPVGATTGVDTVAPCVEAREPVSVNPMHASFFSVIVSIAALTGCSQPPLEGRYVGVDADAVHWGIRLEPQGTGEIEINGAPIRTTWSVIGDTLHVTTMDERDPVSMRFFLVRAREGLLLIGAVDLSNGRVVMYEPVNPSLGGIILHRQPD